MRSIKEGYEYWLRQEAKKTEEVGVSKQVYEIDKRIWVLADLIDEKLDAILGEIENAKRI